MALTLNKIEHDAPELLPTAEKTALSLEKRNLTGLTAAVALVLDYSGSMGDLYRDGSVQELAEKVLAVATQLDDDGEIDIYIFESKAHYLGTLNLANFRDGIKALTQGYRMGTTDYAGAINLVTERSSGAKKKGLFGKKSSGPIANPVLALFVTDGVPDNEGAAKKALIEASFKPVFWQFVSLGGKIPFLDGLDNLAGRDVDNASYLNVPFVATLDDDTLLDVLLSEYPGWVADQRQRGAIQ